MESLIYLSHTLAYGTLCYAFPRISALAIVGTAGATATGLVVAARVRPRSPGLIVPMALMGVDLMAAGWNATLYLSCIWLVVHLAKYNRPLLCT